MASAAALKKRLSAVKMLLLDVDGVLTDGRIIYDSAGNDSKFFDVHDGLGVYLLQKAGIPTALVTAKGSRVIPPRARDMRVKMVFKDVRRKSEVIAVVCRRMKLKPAQLCFVGDDLVDLGVMKGVGLPVAVANACPEIRRVAAYVTRRRGGRGAVREVAEMILKAQGLWDELVRSYDA